MWIPPPDYIGGAFRDIKARETFDSGMQIHLVTIDTIFHQTYDYLYLIEIRMRSLLIEWSLQWTEILLSFFSIGHYGKLSPIISYKWS